MSIRLLTRLCERQASPGETPQMTSAVDGLRLVVAGQRSTFQCPHDAGQMDDALG